MFFIFAPVYQPTVMLTADRNWKGIVLHEHHITERRVEREERDLESLVSAELSHWPDFKHIKNTLCVILRLMKLTITANENKSDVV